MLHAHVERTTPTFDLADDLRIEEILRERAHKMEREGASWRKVHVHLDFERALEWAPVHDQWGAASGAVERSVAHLPVAACGPTVKLPAIEELVVHHYKG